MDIEFVNALDSLRREARHDLRDLRAAVQGLTEFLQESSTGVVRVEGKVALMEQKCESMEGKMMILKAEVDVLETEVNCLKREKHRLQGSWQALVTVALIASALSTFVIKWVGL